MKHPLLTLLALIMVSTTMVAEETRGTPKDTTPNDSVALSFRIMDLLFVYRSPLLPDLRKAVINVEDVLPKEEAIEAASPDFRIEWMIEDQLDPQVFRIKEATLVNHEEMGHFWYVTWELLHSNGGGSSGPPFKYLSIIKGDGHSIQPEISFWNSFPVYGDGVYVRSHFEFEKSTSNNEDKKILFGDEIASLAKKHLTEFSRRHNVKTDESSMADPEGSGKMLRWRLQTQRLFEIDDHRIWELNFTDEKWGAKEALESRELTLWVTLFGEVSKLSLGAEEPYALTTR